MKQRSHILLEVILIGLVLTGLTLSGCGNTASDPAPAAAEAQTATATVSIPQGAVGKGPAAYGTNPLVIQPGTAVTWTNNDTPPHTATSDAGSAETWDSGTLAQGQSFSHTFNNPGTFPYHCTIHGAASMSGVIQVSAASPSPSSVPTAAASPTPVATPTAIPTAIPTAVPTVAPQPTSVPTSSVPYQSNQPKQSDQSNGSGY